MTAPVAVCLGVMLEWLNNDWPSESEDISFLFSREPSQNETKLMNIGGMHYQC